MNILIVDFHAGCVQALLHSLLKLGHEVDVLSYSQHNFIIDESLWNRHFLSGERRKKVEDILNIKEGISVREIASTWIDLENRRGESHLYDISISMFPPEFINGALLQWYFKTHGYAPAHRADLWISLPHKRRRYWRLLRHLLEDKKIHVAATNVLDQAYLEHYLPNISIPLVELPAFQIYEQNSPSQVEESYLAFGTSRLSQKEMRDYEIFYGIKLAPIEQHLTKHYSYQDLLKFSGFFYVPYSGYSITLLELECSGLPVIVPDDRTLIKRKLLHDVRLWHHYANFFKVLIFDFSRRASLNRPGNKNLRTWIKLMQWNNSTLITSNLETTPKREDARMEVQQILANRLRHIAKFLVQIYPEEISKFS